MDKEITIPAQFNGPAASGNGGYVSGILAEAFDDTSAVKVDLKSPPLLDHAFAFDKSDDGNRATLMEGEQVICKAEVTTLDMADMPAMPRLDQVTAAHNNPIKNVFPVLDKCFVCGTDRDDPTMQGGGLHVHAGPVDGREGEIACFWDLSDQWSDDEGNMLPRYIWSALDCPGYYACAPGMPVLLGSMTTQIYKKLPAGGRAIIHGWTKNIGDVSERKRLCGTALYTMDGTLIAASEAVWVIVPQSLYDKLSG